MFHSASQHVIITLESMNCDVVLNHTKVQVSCLNSLMYFILQVKNMFYAVMLSYEKHLSRQQADTYTFTTVGGQFDSMK